MNYLCEYEVAEFLYHHLVQLLSGDALAAPYSRLVQSCQAQGKYKEALQHGEKTLAICLKALEPVQDELIDKELEDIGDIYIGTLLNIGSVLGTQGKHDEARQYFDKAKIAVDPEQALSPLGSLTLPLVLLDGRRGAIFAGIADTLVAQGHYDEARQYLERALEISIKLNGPDDAAVSRYYSCLGLIIWKQATQQGGPETAAQVDEALQFYHKGLAIAIKSLGHDHTSVANSYGNIATALARQGKYEEARSYVEKALAVVITTLGPNHMEVASLYNTLATMMNCGNELRAEYYEKALAILRNALGAEHEHVALLHMNIASDLRRQVVECDPSNTGHARATRERIMGHCDAALAVRLKVLGPERPEIGDTYTFMAEAEWMNGMVQCGCVEAIRLYTAAAAAYCTAYGEDHPKVKGAMSSVEDVELLVKRPLALYKALEAAITAPELSHVEIATAYRNLADGIRPSGYDLYMRVQYYAKALASMVIARGPDHEDVTLLHIHIASSFSNMYDIRTVRRCKQEALGHYGKALTARLKASTPDHHAIGSIYKAMAEVTICARNYQRMEQKSQAAKQESHADDTDTDAVDVSEAKHLFSEAAAAYRTAYGEDHPETQAAVHNAETVT